MLTNCLVFSDTILKKCKISFERRKKEKAYTKEANFLRGTIKGVKKLKLTRLGLAITKGAKRPAEQRERRERERQITEREGQSGGGTTGLADVKVCI